MNDQPQNPKFDVNDVSENAEALTEASASTQADSKAELQPDFRSQVKPQTKAEKNAPRAENWERSVLEKIALEGLAEQRRKRRWGIFFKSAALVYVGLMLYGFFSLMSSSHHEPHGPHTAVVKIDGAIESEGRNSADYVVIALQDAFEEPNAKGVILRINSPGGSPVQSGVINQEIHRLRALYPDKPLHVVVDDICASGGYYIAVAANNIYVDKASLVGSIGVVFSSFGVQEALAKLGVERRTLAAGDNKAFLDPFQPVNEAHKQHMQNLLNEVHQQFIQVVREGRGTRLKETPEIFSGLIWNGARAVELGLADGFGTVQSVARDVIKVKELVDYTVEEDLAERLSKRIGISAGAAVQQILTKAGLRAGLESQTP